MRETTLHTSRSVKKEREKVLQTPQQRFHAICGEDHGQAGWTSWRSTMEQSHLQTLENLILEQVNAPEGDFAPWVLRTEAGFWQNLWPHEREAHTGADLLLGFGTPWDISHWSSLFLKDCTPRKTPVVEQSMKNCSLCE